MHISLLIKPNPMVQPLCVNRGGAGFIGGSPQDNCRVCSPCLIHAGVAPDTDPVIQQIAQQQNGTLSQPTLRQSCGRVLRFLMQA